ncbi:hypothetical protein AG1IA_01498 [Rhizoctonia solani AG-1 IA]|uniref:Uncharacterized protein n=1 Tax=Thanatephorus cucumeris (strain AG1-IA) TaxID=983506 RepID=L8X757_THACA|nr:hypothetical protein AG1IA_01498 [Rhizoctonia solani AG-1 IA]
MQTRPGNAPKATMFGTLTSSVRNLGVRSVYTGISAALMRQMSYSMVRFGCYEHMKNVITDGGSESPVWLFHQAGSIHHNCILGKRPTAVQLIVAGGIAGGLGGIAGNPADVLLVRMTTDEVRPEKDRFRYKHAIDGLIRLVREEGVSALARVRTKTPVGRKCLPISSDPQVLTTRIVSFSHDLRGNTLLLSSI